MELQPFAQTPSARPMPSTAMAAACPRCRLELSQITHQVRREGRMTALLCPSVTCGYKRIVPVCRWGG